MTLAPVGIWVLASAIFSIRSPRTKMSWFLRGVSLVSSMRDPSRMMVSAAFCDADWADAIPAASEAESARAQTIEANLVTKASWKGR